MSSYNIKTHRIATAMTSKSPYLPKSQQYINRKMRFQCKCHWSPSQEQMFQELQQLKEQYNKLSEDHTLTYARANQYEEKCEQLYKTISDIQKPDFVRKSNPKNLTTYVKQIDLQKNEIQTYKKQVTDLKQTTRFQILQTMRDEMESQELIIQDLRERINQQSEDSQTTQTLQKQLQDYRQKEQALQKQNNAQFKTLEETVQKLKNDKQKFELLHEQDLKQKEKIKLLEKQLKDKNLILQTVQNKLQSLEQQKIYNSQKPLPQPQVKSIVSTLQNNLEKQQISVKFLDFVTNQFQYLFEENKPLTVQSLCHSLQQHPCNLSHKEAQTLASHLTQAPLSQDQVLKRLNLLCPKQSSPNRGWIQNLEDQEVMIEVDQGLSSENENSYQDEAFVKKRPEISRKGRSYDENSDKNVFEKKQIVEKPLLVQKITEKLSEKVLERTPEKQKNTQDQQISYENSAQKQIHLEKSSEKKTQIEPEIFTQSLDSEDPKENKQIEQNLIKELESIQQDDQEDLVIEQDGKEIHVQQPARSFDSIDFFEKNQDLQEIDEKEENSQEHQPQPVKQDQDNSKHSHSYDESFEN